MSDSCRHCEGGETSGERIVLLMQIPYKKPKKYLRMKGDLGISMACCTPPLIKAKEQGEIPLPILSPIPFIR